MAGRPVENPDVQPASSGATRKRRVSGTATRTVRSTDRGSRCKAQVVYDQTCNQPVPLAERLCYWHTKKAAMMRGELQPGYPGRGHGDA